MLAIEQAAAHMRSWRLLDTVLYVTMEPCPMCAGAIVQARIPQLVYGAPDEKAGAAGTLYNVCQDDRLNHCLDDHRRRAGRTSRSSCCGSSSRRGGRTMFSLRAYVDPDQFDEVTRALHAHEGARHIVLSGTTMDTNVPSSPPSSTTRSRTP